jgi:hypothetical protein
METRLQVTGTGAVGWKENVECSQRKWVKAPVPPRTGTLTQPAKDRERPSHWEALPTLQGNFVFKLTEAASLSGVPCSDVLEAKPNEGMSTYQNIPRQATNKFFPESSTAFCRSPTHTGPPRAPTFQFDG